MSWRLLLAAIGVIMAFRVATSEASAKAISVQTLQNPFEIRPAVLFAVLFVLLSIVTVLVKSTFGNAGLFLLSGFVGITDVTPFILSLIHGSAPIETMMISAIMIAMMSNTMFKGIYFGVLAKQLRKATFWRYGLWTLLHVPFVLFQ